MNASKLIFAISLFFVTFFSYSQGEFILEINPTTGSYIRPSCPINGVTWVVGYASTYDEIHGLYIFPSTIPSNKLITVNSNDSLFFNPSFSSLTEFQYDNSSGILYGLQNPSAGQFVFGSVNPSTASYTQIGSGTISGMNGIFQGMSTFDKNNHKYIIYVSGNILFSINALNGNVISNPVAVLNSGESLIHICYDDSTNNLYGLLQNNSQTFLVHINTATGMVTKIGNGATCGFGGGTSTIDKINRRYIFSYNLSGNYYVGVMDIPTGNLLYNNLISLGLGDNINSIKYDNVKSKLYAEHWQASSTVSIKSFEKINSLIFYPNPANNNITIKSTEELGTIVIYNVIGEVMLQKKTKSNIEQIDISNFLTGIYTIQVKNTCNKIIKD